MCALCRLIEALGQLGHSSKPDDILLLGKSFEIIEMFMLRENWYSFFGWNFWYQKTLFKCPCWKGNWPRSRLNPFLKHSMARSFAMVRPRLNRFKIKLKLYQVKLDELDLKIQTKWGLTWCSFSATAWIGWSSWWQKFSQ